MKKISLKRKIWLMAHQRKIERRRHLKRYRKRGGKSAKPAIILRAPDVMCLKRNFLGTCKFIHRFRELALDKLRKKKFSVDFRTIHTLSPDAALILAAELDRWRLLQQIKLKPWKVSNWNYEVKRLFGEMGLFNLLKINKKERTGNKEGALKLFKFLTGNESDGSIADKLMTVMNPVIGPYYNEEKLYIALSEAMTNVVQHAYPESAEYEHEIIPKQWWLAGSYNKKTGKMKVMFYDQGVGIPATLPRQNFWEKFLLIYKSKGYIVDNHGHLIKGAIEIGRTRSKEPHRGKGLNQLLDFSINSHSGKLRIISGKGDYLTGKEELGHCNTHQIELGGTFIQWEIKICEEVTHDKRD